MKNLFFLLLALSLSAASPLALAQNNVANDRMLEKEFSSRLKWFNKEGWKIYNSPYSLDVALVHHYYALSYHDAFEFSDSLFSPVCSVSPDSLRALACSQYISLPWSGLWNCARDALPSSQFSDLDPFFGDFERALILHFQDVASLSFILYRPVQREDGSRYEFCSFFAVFRLSASKALFSAFDEAARNNNLSQQVYDLLSGFVLNYYNAE